jgi:predicted AAA+ superfamily ATPase
LLGRILESFVAGELAKQLSWTAPQTKLCHFRTATGSEIDFLLEDSRGAIAGIEVKASASVGPSDFAPLRNLQSQLGSQFQFGAVLYLGDQIIPFGDRLWLLPIQALWAK